MHIILEGPDNAGKTTLGKQLKAMVPELTYFHPGGPPKTFAAETDCVEEQLALLEEPTPHLIDRITPISQYIYNRGHGMDKVRMGWLKSFVRRNDVLIIYCRPTMDKLLRLEDMTWSAHDTEEMKQKVINNHHQHCREYDILFTAIPHLHYNFEDESAGHLRKYIADAICEDKAAKRFISNMITAGGM